MLQNRRLPRRALVGAAVLLTTLLASAPAQAKIVVGIQDDDVLVYQNYYGRDAGLKVMADTGLGPVRINVPWTRLLVSGQGSRNASQAQRTTYDFTKWDEAVAALTAAGHPVQLAVTGPFPAWATSDGKVGYTNPNAQAFASYARAVAERFKGKVTAISVLNEPNWPTLLRTGRKCQGEAACGTAVGRLYRGLYSRAYSAIKAADPKHKVWIGETTSVARKTTKGYAVAPLAFLRAVLCVNATSTRRSCPGLKADGVAHHPYLLGVDPKKQPPGPDSVTMANLKRLDTALTKFEKLGALKAPKGKLPVYLTEYGFTTNGGSKTVSASRQAAWTIQGLRLAAKGGPRIKQVILYQIADPPNLTPRTWASGMLTGAGAPKPLVQQLPGAIKSLR
jgi:aryl-phospho-beta-D-glucosidase BglC (GH1 family)